MDAWALLSGVAAVALILTVLALGPEHLYRGWKLRSIPGPHSHPVWGNLLDIVRTGSAPFFIKLRALYGPVFKVFLGRHPMVVLTDPDHIRYAALKANNRMAPLNILRGVHKEVVENDLVFARDELWRTLRKAWQPAFSSSSLTGYLALMDQSAQRLVSVLRAKCGDSDGAGERADIHWELGRMTLQVVGSCAYGVDFHCLDDAVSKEDTLSHTHTTPSDAPPGLVLARALRVIFDSASLQRGSKWSRVAMLAPSLRPLVSRLAYLLPDQSFQRQIQAREHLLNVTRDLIDSSTRNPGAAPPAALPDAPKPLADAAGPPTIVARAGSPGVSGVRPGSFLGLMLAARNKQTGEALTDVQVMAQAQVFIFAGYETTSNALAFTIYLVSKHPEVQERLLAEVDRVVASAGGPDAPLTQEALEQCEYITAVFNEALRLYPPAHVTTRDVRDTMTVGKQTIPSGSKLFLSIYASHYDETHWPQPQEFRPDRFLTGEAHLHSHLPFGTGARMCIGQKFAMLEAKVALIRLYSRMTFDLEPGQDPLPLAFGITMSPRNGIWVRPRLRR